MVSNVPNRTEAEMIAAILAGDTQLFHELIRPHERAVYMMALSYMKNEADAEDVAQEAIVRAFRHLSSFRSESRFSTWLISITLNEARSRLRRQTTVRMESLDSTADEDSPVSPALLRDWREIPSEAVERSEVKVLLQNAIQNLPDIYREVFLLRDVEELNINETAETLKISAPAVKVRLHRARMMLQKQLAPQLKTMNQCGKGGGCLGHRMQTRLGTHFRISGWDPVRRNQGDGAEAPRPLRDMLGDP